MGVIPEAADPHVAVKRTELTVYGAMMLLGIIEAALIKGVADSNVALAVVVITGALGIIIAHGWSSVVAHRLVDRQQLSREAIGTELWFAGSVALPAGLALAVLMITAPLEDFDLSALLTQVMMMSVLFVIGFVGARRTGSGLLGAFAWGTLDVGVGVLMVLVKDLLSFIAK